MALAPENRFPRYAGERDLYSFAVPLRVRGVRVLLTKGKRRKLPSGKDLHALCELGNDRVVVVGRFFPPTGTRG